MPSKTNKLVIEVKTSQDDAAAFAKLEKTLRSLPGAQAGGGRIGGTFGSEGAMLDWIKTQAAESKKLGLQMGKVGVSQTEGGDWQASAAIQKKAFSPGGTIAGIATVVGGIGAGFAKLISLSQVFSTFMSTTGKILGTAVDLMLAPLMPIFVKIMVWIIQTVFPLATKVGGWLEGMFGDLSGGQAVGALVAGYVGLKITQAALTGLGTKLGSAFLNHFDATSFGNLIMNGLKGATALITDFGETVALKIMLGMDSAKVWFEDAGKLIKQSFKDVGTFFTDSGNAIRTAFMGDAGWFARMGTSISTAWEGAGEWFSEQGTKIKTAMKPLTTWFSESGSAIRTAFTADDGFFKKAGESIKSAFSTGYGTKFSTWGGQIKTALMGDEGWFARMGTSMRAAFRRGTAWFSARGLQIQEGFRGMTGSPWAKSIGTAIGGGLAAAKDKLGAVGRAIGNTVGTGMSAVGSFKNIGGLIGVGIGAAAIGAAIGYAMWRSYKAKQAGEDIFSGLSRTKQVEMLSGEYGMTTQQAITMITSMTEGMTGEKGDLQVPGIARTEDRFKIITDTYRDVVKEFEYWGTVSQENLMRLTRDEQKLLSMLIERGEIGDFGPDARYDVDWLQRILVGEMNRFGVYGKQASTYESAYHGALETTALPTAADQRIASDYGMAESFRAATSADDQATRATLDKLYRTTEYSYRGLAAAWGGWKKELTREEIMLANFAQHMLPQLYGDVSGAGFSRGEGTLTGDYGVQNLETILISAMNAMTDKTGVTLNFNVGDGALLSEAQVLRIKEYVDAMGLTNGVATSVSP